MEIRDTKVDGGKAFDWGRTSEDYARFRDIYPERFYKKIVERNLCVRGQKVLDLGTGTGVLPRNMYRYGAEWIGTDLSENQIHQARKLSEQQKMNITYETVAAEHINYPAESFDVVTACQCFFYFDHEKVMPNLARILKKEGSLLLLYMAWLPYEDEIARASEELVLSYNPNWMGAGETRRPIDVPSCVHQYFVPVHQEEYDLSVPFTRETWHGRMKACRGVGASLSPEEIREWEREHTLLLEQIAPDQFTIKHYAAMLELKKRERFPQGGV